MRKIHEAFTIIELLIVIVVIGILAAISMVAYSGIQRQAAETGLKVDLAQAARQLGLSQAENDEYPGEDDVITDGLDIDLQPSADNTFQYTRTNEGASYCLTATSSRDGVPSFMVSSDNTTPRLATPDAACSGHMIVTEDGDDIEGTNVRIVERPYTHQGQPNPRTWLVGQGFEANETVHIERVFTVNGHSSTETAIADTNGSFEVLYNLCNNHVYDITARGQTSGYTATTSGRLYGATEC